MRMFIYGIVAIVLWSGVTVARAEVYRCENPEVGVIFQQTPCAVPESDDAGEDAESEEGSVDLRASDTVDRAVVGRDEDVEDVIAKRQEEERQSAEIRACKQKYRDAIDAIDIEIQNSYTPEQREYYLERLTALTKKMRAC
jgi:hypothetical protein